MFDIQRKTQLSPWTEIQLFLTVTHFVTQIGTQEMTYILCRAKKYYFSRRVPLDLREYDPRGIIRFSLKTDSRSEALKRSAWENAKLEQYWGNLVQTGQKHSHEHYRQVVERANLLGFSYMPIKDLAGLASSAELIKRLLFLDQQKLPEKQVEAVLGAVEQPVIMLGDVLPKFWELSKDIRINKTEHQVRKWKNPRKLTMKNFIKCVGNKPLHELNRDDCLKYRDWWIERIEANSATGSTANKNIVYIKTILARVSEHYKISLDIRHLFSKLSFEDDSGQRKSFSTEYLRNTLLNPQNLKGMDEIPRCLLYVFAETGLCFAEQLSLLPEDIRLNDPIPHIALMPRKKLKLKTKYRKREIPLTGFALDVFKKYPEGFSLHVSNPDSLSTRVNKFLRENNLLPSDMHSVYSLRHSFQDRLLSENTPDRIQANLMGHKFQRPTYGNGPTLAHKLEWMEKIRLK